MVRYCEHLSLASNMNFEIVSSQVIPFYYTKRGKHKQYTEWTKKLGGFEVIAIL